MGILRCNDVRSAWNMQPDLASLIGSRMISSLNCLKSHIFYEQLHPAVTDTTVMQIAYNSCEMLIYSFLFVELAVIEIHL